MRVTMFRGMFRALMWQWLFSSMTRRSDRGGGWWGRRTTYPARRPAPAPARGWTLGRFLLIVLLACAALFLYNRFTAPPERYDRDLPPYEEPRGGW